jgi:hypothetical protein
MSRWYSWHFWASETKIRAVFNKFGYNIQTVRCYLGQEFGYKNEKAIVDDLGVKKSFLDAKLVYKNDEIPELNRRLSDLIEQIRGVEDSRYWMKNIYVLRRNTDPGSYDLKETVYRYTMKYRFKELIENFLDVNIEDY